MSTNASTESDPAVTLVLAEFEKDALIDAAISAAPDPYEDPAGFRAVAREVWRTLRSSTRDRFAELASGESLAPELHVQNLPFVPSLPPTPPGGSWTRTTTGHFSEMLMVAFTTELGFPMSYADQRDGAVFHDIYPTQTNAAKVSSQSHKIGLGFHSEMFFHPTPPAFLMLHCLRPDSAGAALTGVADLATIEQELSAADLAELRKSEFALDLASLHGSYTYDGRAISETDSRPCVPIITDDDGVRFRFEPALTTAMHPEGKAALARAERVAEANADHYALSEGSMLVLDNRRTAHSRSSFPARYDGSDRWLRRVMVSDGATKSTDGIHRSPDLDLLKMWRAKGVAFEHVPYGIAKGAEE